jgi:hypothetical protein
MATARAGAAAAAPTAATAATAATGVKSTPAPAPAPAAASASAPVLAPATASPAASAAASGAADSKAASKAASKEAVLPDDKKIAVSASVLAAAQSAVSAQSGGVEIPPDFECCLCLRLFYDPVKTPCNHVRAPLTRSPAHPSSSLLSSSSRTPHSAPSSPPPLSLCVSVCAAVLFVVH